MHEGGGGEVTSVVTGQKIKMYSGGIALKSIIVGPRITHFSSNVFPSAHSSGCRATCSNSRVC